MADRTQTADEKTLRAEREHAAHLLSAQFAPETLGEDGTMAVRLYGGEQVTRFGWDGPWLLRLSLDEGAVDTSRLARGVTVTAGHTDMSAVLASVGRTIPGTETITAEGVTARFQVADEDEVTPALVPVVRQLKSGMLRDVSVQVGEWTLERAEDEDRDEMKAYVATRWEIAALAVVVAGASATSTTLSHEPGREPATKETPMDPIAKTPEQLAADTEAVRLAAVADERKRADEITALGKASNLPDLAAQFCKDGKSVADFQAAALAALVEKQQASNVGTTNPGAHVQVTADAGDHALAGIAEVLANKIDPNCPVGEHGKRLAHLSAARLAGKFLGVHGVNAEAFSDRDIVAKAMDPRAFTQTTGDFTNLIAAGFNRSLSRGFPEAVRTFQPWTESITVDDLEGFDVIGLDDVPALQAVPEGALYPLVALTDKKESGTVTKSGNRVLLTMEALLGDRLGGFQQIMNRMRYRALMLEETTTYGVLTTNANMRDGVALFHGTHANLAGAGTISPATVSELQGFLAAQTDANGGMLGIRGRYLVGGYGTIEKWNQYLSEQYKPTSAANALTTTMRGLVPVDSPVSLGTKFFVIAEPMMGGTVTVARVRGYESPTVIMTERPERDCWEYQVRHMFGAKAAEWRTMAYNPGA